MVLGSNLASLKVKNAEDRQGSQRHSLKNVRAEKETDLLNCKKINGNLKSAAT